ncbi:hypothetical protein CQ045_15240 [Microbacterium sp. MYb66]|nr:hypothetical protein CQ045_15240 [Microbacterium sp. MYb66]
MPTAPAAPSGAFPPPPAYPAPTVEAAASAGAQSPTDPAYPAPPTYPSAQAPQAAPAPAYPAAPPGAYQVPVGGYAAPAGAYTVPETAARPSGFLGMLALGLALVAAIVTPIVAGINAFEIGRLLPQGISTSRGDLSALSPARDQVLWAELSFWGGTILGIAAIVLGIIAIRKKQGRGTGIAALVVAVFAAVIFFVVLGIAFATGGAAGFATYTS